MKEFKRFDPADKASAPMFISDDELDNVSGGATHGYRCAGCGATYSDQRAFNEHLLVCPAAIAMRENGRTR